jgi:phospholipase/carboxylesterase
MGWMSDELQARVPAIITFAPNAPHRSDLNASGLQWFSIHGVTDGNRATRVHEANVDLVARIQIEQTRLGLGWDRTVVIGFSQGAILALAMAVALDPAPALVVALSGRLALPVTPGAASRGHVILSHGTADAVIPFKETERAAEFLRNSGCDVGVQAMIEQGHYVSVEQIQMVASALERIFGSTSASLS